MAVSNMDMAMATMRVTTNFHQLKSSCEFFQRKGLRQVITKILLTAKKGKMKFRWKPRSFLREGKCSTISGENLAWVQTLPQYAAI